MKQPGNQRLLCLPLRKRVDQKDALASTTLASQQPSAAVVVSDACSTVCLSTVVMPMQQSLRLRVTWESRLLLLFDVRVCPREISDASESQIELITCVMSSHYHHHCHRQRGTRERNSRFPGANCAEQNYNQKHRLGTLLRSATEGRATLQDSSLPQRRNCVKFVHKPTTVAVSISTGEPSSAPTDQVISRRIQYRVPQATPRHLGIDCQIHGRRVIMHHISRANRASNPGKNSYKASVGWHMMMNPTQP